MNKSSPLGLGDPEPAGKLALFQPPRNNLASSSRKIRPRPDRTEAAANQEPERGDDTQSRIRTTINLTQEALKVIQAIQQEHRLLTGKVLPLWKAVSQAIAFYGLKKRKNQQ